MRAFIFSLDAFVAFTLALIAIYSLIFFSSASSSYYYLLTQGHYLSKDVLMTLSTSACSNDYYVFCKSEGESLLDNIVAQSNREFQRQLIQDTVGKMIPQQFGYKIEVSDIYGRSETLYDTSTNPEELELDRPHATGKKKLSVASQVMTFGYSYTFTKPSESVYAYNTCHGDRVGAEGMITCGTSGNSPPTSSSGLDMVPSSEVKVVRLTVFI